MTVADDLQTIVGDLSAAIAGRKTYGRAELEQLRRQLTTAARDARATGGAVGRVDLVRIKRSLDRPAILKALAADDTGLLTEAFGLSARQRDEFFIDRAAQAEPAVETVPEQEQSA